MRKLTIFAAICVLLSAMILVASADTGSLTMTDVQASPGDVIQITVSLNEDVKGNAMGITYSYDTNQLKVLPDQCGWSTKGILKDFSSNQNGVWAVNDATDLKGDICVLVFQVLENATFTETEVSCTLIVKNGTKEVGTYQGNAAISRQCSHTFGQWSDSGEMGHSHSCTLCKKTETQSHAWVEGPVEQDPKDSSMGIKTSTCSVCAGTRSEKVPNYGSSHPTTEPTVERKDEDEVVPVPTQEHPKPTYPADNDEPVPDNSQTLTGNQNTTSTKPTQNSSQQNTTNQQNTSNQQNQESKPQDYTPNDYNRPPEETKSAEIKSPVTGPTPSASIPGQQLHPDGETTPMVIPIVGWTGEEETHVHTDTEMEIHDHESESTSSKLSPIIFVATVAVLAAAGMVLYKKTKRK